MKRLLLILFFVIFFLGSFNVQAFEGKIFKKNNDKLVLKPLKNDKIYFGAFPDFGGSEDQVSAKRINDFNSLVGKKIFWAYFSNNWGEDGIKFPLKKVEIIDSTGTIPFIRMMPRKDFENKEDKTFSLQKIIDGKFDDSFYKYALDVKKYKKMVLIDFAPEMNGDWFPWSGVFNGGKNKTKYGDIKKEDGPERYVDAYRHIVDIFRKVKVTNVTWFWHPDVYSNPNVSWNKQKKYYPGDDYVDWIGISAYGPQNPKENYWDSFSTIMNETKKDIIEITNKNKPLALLEFGVTDNHLLGKKDLWIKDAFKYILDKKKSLQFNAISPWNETWEDNGVLATVSIDSSKSSLKIFKKYINNKRFIGQEKNKKTNRLEFRKKMIGRIKKKIKLLKQKIRILLNKIK